jgi:CubicO group peptidase (beta-lactamase class C family)
MGGQVGEVSGHCDQRFEELRETMAGLIAAGDELGASLVVDIDGSVVADLWGGFCDEDRRRPWQQETIVNVWSTTKTVTALAALHLASAGRLDLDSPVARYWPEFAANGKEGVLVRHLLSHASGVSGLDPPATIDDLYDLDRAAARFAAQAPWWEPASASGYHALNYGHLIGEVIRRITGRTLRTYVEAELAGPAGADFQIGCRPADTHRVAPIVPPPPLEALAAGLDPASVAVRTLTGPLIDAAAANTDAWRAAEIGGANGHGNARSVARLLSAVTRGGRLDGLELLAPELVERIFDVQVAGIDLVLGVPVTWGVGFALGEGATVPYLPPGRVCFWGGWGGSVILMDLDRRVTVSYMMNRMAAGIIGSPRAEAYVRAVYRSLGLELPSA